MEDKNPKPPMFELTEDELLWDKVTDKRLRELMNHPDTRILECKVDGNNYGEWMFVTVTAILSRTYSYDRNPEPKRRALQFWGMGYHEQREKWMVGDWKFHDAQFTSMTDKGGLKEAMIALIDDRIAYCKAEAGFESDKQTSRGRAFEFLAELGDEDSAYTDLEDNPELEDLFA